MPGTTRTEQAGDQGTSRREIGDEYSAGRALIGLGNQLLRAGRTDAAPSDIAVPG